MVVVFRGHHIRRRLFHLKVVDQVVLVVQQEETHLLRNPIQEDHQYKVHNQEIPELMVLDLLVAEVIKLEILILLVETLVAQVVVEEVRSVIVEFGPMIIHLTQLLQEKVAPEKM